MPTAYRFAPIDPDAADHLRAAGGVGVVADDEPGYPCRQCLRDAAVGEAVVLVAHDPFRVDSPYRSRSPIFLHERACTPPTDLTGVPEQLMVRRLSVRAFDARAMMLDAEVVEGTELDHTLRRILDDEAVSEVHVHNAVRGCWATSVVRSPPG